MQKQEGREKPSKEPGAGKCRAFRSGRNTFNRQEGLQDGFDLLRLLFDLKDQRSQESLEMRMLMLTFAIGQREQWQFGFVGEHGTVLQIVDSQHNDRKPLFNGFEGLQTEVTETEDFFEIEIIDFDRPTLLINSQGFLSRQGSVGAQEVLGEGDPRGVFLR